VRILIEIGGNGHKPPGQTPPPGQKTPGEKVPSGDIFYCSGSRQLNHSSFQTVVFIVVTVQPHIYNASHVGVIVELLK